MDRINYLTGAPVAQKASTLTIVEPAVESGRVTPPTAKGGITPNDGTGVVTLIETASSGDFLALLDLANYSVPIVSYRDVVPSSVVAVEAYVGPASIFDRVITPSFDTYQTNITSFDSVFNNTGAVLAVPGATSISFRNITCFGLLFSMFAEDTTSQVNETTLNLVDNGGSVLNSFKFKLRDVNVEGKVFTFRTSRGITQTNTPSAGAVGAFGAFANDTEISFLQTNTPQTSMMKLILSDADTVASAQNYYVVQAKGTRVQAFPVLVTVASRAAFFQFLFAGRLDQFGQWAIDWFLATASSRKV